MELLVIGAPVNLLGQLFPKGQKKRHSLPQVLTNSQSLEVGCLYEGLMEQITEGVPLR